MNLITKNIELGNRIKAIRMKLGKNQTEFGNMFDPPAPKGAVSRWEHGGSPNKKRLKKIADLGGVSVEFLVNGAPSLTLAEIKELSNRVKHGTATDFDKSQLKDVAMQNYINFSSIRDKFASDSNKRIKEEQQLFASKPLNFINTMALAYAMNIINEVRIRGNTEQQNSISIIFRGLDSIIDGKYQMDIEPQELINELKKFISSLPLDKA